LIKKRVFIFLIFVIILSFSFLACKGRKGDEFYDMDEQASGGSPTSEMGMNIKDIDINYFQNQTEIALHIVYGSREEIQSEAIITNLPKYEVFLLDEPYRLGVRLYGIEFVDYIQKSDWALDEHVVGVFRERVAGKDYTTVYFQLNSQVKFRVDEGDGKIRIVLETEETGKEENHFVMLNAFDEYLEGAFGEDYGLSPVLCADRVNIAMISKPLESFEEAEALLAELSLKIEKSPISKTPYTMTLAGEVLPIMNSDIDVFLPANKKMVIEDNVAKTLPVLIENGKFIAQSENMMLYVKPYIPKEGDAFFAGEELWALTNLDKKAKLDLPPFNFIQGASFSKDGRYIGFIDVSVDSKVLYVYDLQNLILYNLGEEGFGNITSSFVWSEEYSSIYAITGNDNLQLAKCDFTETGIKISAITENTEGEGKIADFGDRIIFADNFAGEHGIIYGIDKKTGKKEFLTEGVDFKISPDRANMAVLEYNDFGEESAYVNLKLYSLLDQSETTIVKGGIVESYEFLPTSNTLLYSDGTKSDYTYRFLYSLESYHLNTGVKDFIANMATGEFYLSKFSAESYLIDYYLGDDGRYNYTTYLYKLEQ